MIFKNNLNENFGFFFWGGLIWQLGGQFKEILIYSKASMGYFII